MEEKKETDYVYARLPLSEDITEALSKLPKSWQVAPNLKSHKTKVESRQLRNLVVFAISFIQYLEGLGITIPTPLEFDDFFAKLWAELSNSVLFASKFKEWAVTNDLPVPDAEDIQSWFSSFVDIKNQVGEPQGTDSVADYLREIINRDNIDIKIDNKEDLILLLKKLFAIYYNYINLVDNLALYGVPEPTTLGLSDWINNYTKIDKSQSQSENSSHELLDILINMKSLPPEEDMVFLAHRFKVRTKQLYRIYYMMHGCDDDNCNNCEDNILNINTSNCS
ncbi:MAG: hypothetical protein KME64_42905 [Scytonematopsis contorta HA4267-MV1]|jgi:hypothetical protein|nr:hypothetical protein [Scytonematopsis contorta HA4267-MV1]